MTKWDDEANKQLKAIVAQLRLSSKQAQELQEEIHSWADSASDDAEHEVTKVGGFTIWASKQGGRIIEIRGAGR
jgi:hypothetical protein